LRTKLISLSTALINKLDNFHTKYPSHLPELDKLLNPILNHPISVELAIRNKALFLEPPSPPSKLKDIQTSLASITKALSDLQRKVNSTPPTSTPTAPTVNSKAPSRSNPKTYSAAARSRAQPHSLVLSLSHLSPPPACRPTPESICTTINSKLAKASHNLTKIAAIHWIAKGNLIIFSLPPTSPSALQTTASHIPGILTAAFKLPPTKAIPPARTNTKWSKITINGLPTGASTTRGVYTLEECHTTLSAHNPAYASLSVTQLPSWVCPPASYSEGTISSLSLSFEDPDGHKLKALLTNWYLYCFGNRASIRKWKQCKPSHKPPAKLQGDNTSNVKFILNTPQPSQQQQPQQSNIATIKKTTFKFPLG
jgi:hypothetical protein